jgi:chitin disaccharide deacetylase
MTAARCLIVNADDFGQSFGVNRGIIEAHERGILTSASLMVRWPAAEEAAAYCRQRVRLDLGLHLDFGEWAYRDESWTALYEVVPPDDGTAVAAEVSRQLASFRRLVGKDPTHFDSHQHIHRDDPLRSILLEVARKLSIPVRSCSAAIHYCGDFYGQTGKGEPVAGAISVQGLVRILKGLPAGLTELSCHPGLDGDVDSMYRWERAEEVKALCDPRVREVVAAEGIDLCSFAGLAERPDLVHPVA